MPFIVSSNQNFEDGPRSKVRIISSRALRYLAKSDRFFCLFCSVFVWLSHQNSGVYMRASFLTSFLFVSVLFFSTNLWAATQLECRFSELHGEHITMLTVNKEIDEDGAAILAGQFTINTNIEFHASINRLNRIYVSITDNATQVSAINTVRHEKSAMVALDKSSSSSETYRLECGKN